MSKTARASITKSQNTPHSFNFYRVHTKLFFCERKLMLVCVLEPLFCAKALKPSRYEGLSECKTEAKLAPSSTKKKSHFRKLLI